MWKRDIIIEACRRFNGEPTSLQLIGGFYRNIYQYQRDGQTYLLKVFPTASKDRSDLYTEMDWIDYLRQHGLSVPHYIRSIHDDSVELIHRLPFPSYAVSYAKGEGEWIRHKTHHWNDQLFIRLGQVMGHLHALAKDYTATHPNLTLDEWNEGEIYHRDLSAISLGILKKWNDRLETIRSLPRTNENYGLIHNGFHPNHFLLNNQGHIRILHFDAMKSHWFSYDIAIALYHFLEGVPASEQKEQKERFLRSFLKGYHQILSTSTTTFEEIEFFYDFYRLFRYLYLMIYLHEERRSDTMKQYLHQTRIEIEQAIRI